MKSDVLIIRIGFIILLALMGFLLNPLADTQHLGEMGGSGRRIVSAILGAAIAACIVAFEMRVKKASLKTLIGAAVGSILGIIGAYLIGMLISSQETKAIPAEMKTFLTVALAFFMAYIGLMVGAAKGDFLDLSILGGVFSDKSTVKHDYRILDTSVIIDGRIADVAETGFLGGTLIIPQFILRELQQNSNRSQIHRIHQNDSADDAGSICSSALETTVI
jgi:uncharacterized protein YacL